MAINQQGGLLAQAGAGAPPQQAPQQVPQEQPQPQPSIAPTGEGEVSDESQDIYDRVVTAGMKVLYEDENTKQQIVSRLQADSDNPAKTLADTVTMLMIQLDQQAGGKIPEDVIIPAAVELLEQTADIAESLDIVPIDNAIMNHAAQLMMVSIAEEYGTTPEEIQEVMNSMSTDELTAIEQEQGNYARKQPSQQAV